MVGGDLDDGDVGQFVGAEQLGRQFGAVGQRHHDAVGGAYDVIVGDDDAGGIDDEAGAGALDLLAAAAKAVAQFVLDLRRQTFQRIIAGDGFGDADVDHGRQHPAHQRGKAVRADVRPSRARRQKHRHRSAEAAELAPGQVDHDELRSVFRIMMRMWRFGRTATRLR